MFFVVFNRGEGNAKVKEIDPLKVERQSEIIGPHEQLFTRSYKYNIELHGFDNRNEADAVAREIVEYFLGLRDFPRRERQK